MNLDSSLDYLQTRATTLSQYAHPEGNNIMTWLGFKHIMYAAELGLMEHLRASGLGMRRLFEEHGLVAEIVHADGRILHALKLDELLRTEVAPAPPRRRRDGCLDFEVHHYVDRGGNAPLKAYAGHLRLRLRRDASLGLSPVAGHPQALRPFLTDVAADPGPVASGARATDRPGPSNVFTLRVPYYFCHGNERMKMSAYLRLMERADAEFCDARGIQIERLLDERRWIPAVPSASMTILGEARMGEELRVSYEVVDVVKSFTYRSSMDCHVRRGDDWVHVATGEIVHAYAQIHSRSDWGMVNFDERVLHAIGA